MGNVYAAECNRLRVIHGIPGERIGRAIIVGTGHSLKDFDFGLLNTTSATVFAVNRAIDFVSRAGYWHSADSRAWGSVRPHLANKTKNYIICEYIFQRTDWRDTINAEGNLFVVRRDSPKPEKGFSKLGTRSYDSGLSAMNMAILMGAKQIVLLGLDGQGSDFWNPEKRVTRLGSRYFPRAYEQCEKWGIDVINGSPISLWDGWPRMQPEKAIGLLGAL